MVLTVCLFLRLVEAVMGALSLPSIRILNEEPGVHCVKWFDYTAVFVIGLADS